MKSWLLLFSFGRGQDGFQLFQLVFFAIRLQSCFVSFYSIAAFFFPEDAYDVLHQRQGKRGVLKEKCIY